MKLQSRVCEILEIEQPIVLAGMGGASSPALAAAVSNAFEASMDRSCRDCLYRLGIK